MSGSGSGRSSSAEVATAGGTGYRITAIRRSQSDESAGSSRSSYATQARATNQTETDIPSHRHLKYAATNHPSSNLPSIDGSGMRAHNSKSKKQELEVAVDAAQAEIQENASSPNERNDSQARRSDDEEMAASSPLPPQEEFGFKRMLHAIDSFIHSPAKIVPNFIAPCQQHEGTTAGVESTRASSASRSNPDCTATTDCHKNSQLQQNNDKKEHGQPSQPQQHDETKNSLHTSRPLRAFTSLSTSVASAFTFQNYSRDSPRRAQPSSSQFESFLPFPFRIGSRPLPSANTRGDPQFRGPLLYGTSNPEQHEAVIKTAILVGNLYDMGQDVTRRQYSRNNAEVSGATGDGEDKGGKTSDNDEDEGCEEEQNAFDYRARHALSSLGFEFLSESCHNSSGENGSAEDNTRTYDTKDSCECHSDCTTRLYHVRSNTAVTKENRRTLIADGKMYEVLAHLCQAAAQEIMAESCDLVWVIICDGKGGGLRTAHQYTGHDPRSSEATANSIQEWPRDEAGNIVVQEPIRALVSGTTTNLKPRDTFLVATGKGKVRAGIFSRHHLMTTGLYAGTALPLLCEARDRGMNCVVIDPNARGDRHGMATFEVSIRSLFELPSFFMEGGGRDANRMEEVLLLKEIAMQAIIPAGAIYVLAHSAGGGQLVRFLLNQQKGASLLSRIRCMAFTDSTHSIQWLKQHQHISALIQSSNALYVKSANPMRDYDWKNALAGVECPCDEFWVHRFGGIKTVWAGTTEHSLTNWTAHKPIWKHFDRFLPSAS